MIPRKNLNIKEIKAYSLLQVMDNIIIFAYMYNFAR
jgi:hypothetical protein